jgi:mono/diheme cytochrome c family protein
MIDNMNRSLGFPSVFLIVASAAFGQSAASSTLSKKAAWGKYLAEEVGKCHECHTPNAEDGKLDKARYMKGKVMEVQPIGEILRWHKSSPDITPSGKLWAKWGGEEAMKKYLITGLTPSGRPAGPPMPTYTLKPEDAEAIVEFLKTLP